MDSQLCAQEVVGWAGSLVPPLQCSARHALASAPVVSAAGISTQCHPVGDGGQGLAGVSAEKGVSVRPSRTNSTHVFRPPVIHDLRELLWHCSRSQGS